MMQSWQTMAYISRSQAKGRAPAHSSVSVRLFSTWPDAGFQEGVESLKKSSGLSCRCTNLWDRAWPRQHGGYQHCSEKHLHRYLAEFDFRYSNRIALGIGDIGRTVAAIRGADGKRLLYRQPRQTSFSV